MKLLITLFVAASIAAPAFAKTHRDASQVRAFKREHHCPSTGRASGKCPGYIVDHRTALCRGGADHPSNMQWQTKSDAKAKDRWECR
jgi:hypothetical protein